MTYPSTSSVAESITIDVNEQTTTLTRENVEQLFQDITELACDQTHPASPSAKKIQQGLLKYLGYIAAPNNFWPYQKIAINNHFIAMLQLLQFGDGIDVNLLEKIQFDILNDEKLSDLDFTDQDEIVNFTALLNDIKATVERDVLRATPIILSTEQPLPYNNFNSACWYTQRTSVSTEAETALQNILSNASAQSDSGDYATAISSYLQAESIIEGNRQPERLQTYAKEIQLQLAETYLVYGKCLAAESGEAFLELAVIESENLGTAGENIWVDAQSELTYIACVNAANNEVDSSFNYRELAINRIRNIFEKLSPSKFNQLKKFLEAADKIDLLSHRGMVLVYQQVFIKTLMEHITLTHQEYDTDQLGYLTNAIFEMTNKIPIPKRDPTCFTDYSNLINLLIDHLTITTENLASQASTLSAMTAAENNYLMILELYTLSPKEEASDEEKKYLSIWYQSLLLFTFRRMKLTTTTPTADNINYLYRLMDEQEIDLPYNYTSTDDSFEYNQRIIAHEIFYYALEADLSFETKKEFANLSYWALNKIAANTRTDADDYDLAKILRKIQQYDAELILELPIDPAIRNIKLIERFDIISNTIAVIENGKPFKDEEDSDRALSLRLSQKQHDIISAQKQLINKLIVKLKPQTFLRQNSFLKCSSQKQADKLNLRVGFCFDIEPLIGNKDLRQLNQAEASISAYLNRASIEKQPLLHDILNKINLLKYMTYGVAYHEAALTPPISPESQLQTTSPWRP